MQSQHTPQKPQVTFEQGYTPSQKNLHIMQRLSVDNKTWIGNGAWQSFGFPSVCQHVKLWTIQQGLGLIGNQRDKILKDIALISFPNLKKIHLGNNGIHSLEFLYKLQLPSLVALDISDNLIVTTKGLAKVSLLTLAQLDIFGNKINNFDGLSGTNLPAIEDLKRQESNSLSIYNTLSVWMVKNDWKKLKKLNLRGQELTKKISHKFKQIHLSVVFSGGFYIR